MEKIKGYTLHGDYYLADKVIPDKTAYEALHTEEEITLSNGKTVIARVLSREELDTIPLEERQIEVSYWTSTEVVFEHTYLACWALNSKKSNNFFGEYTYGGTYAIRLGFKNPFI